MTTIEQIAAARPSAKRRTDRPASSWRFDLLMSLCMLWLITGAMLDGWAHNHLGDDLETFFTPWHATLYSGFLASMIVTYVAWLRNISKGYHWQRAMPGGYDLSLIGTAMFALAGMGDMFWHVIFGVEANIEAAFSPTHQLLMVSMVLITLGPLRSALRQDASVSSFVRFLPAALAIALCISGLSFLFQSMHLFVVTFPTVEYTPINFTENELYQELGIASGMLQIGLLMGMALLCIRRWGSKIPFGTFTLIFLLNSIALSTQRDEYILIPAMVLGGLAADSLIRWLRPSDERRAEVRLFAIIVPVVLYVAYFVILALTTEFWWTMHTIGGVVVSGAGAALLLSYLAFMPVTQPD